MFELDARLHADTLHISDLDLCRVLLMNDSQFPWVILVPMVPNVGEIIELNDEQQWQLHQESAFISRILQGEFQPDKLNIAALGNVVNQLHVHHVARYITDCAWPAPIWGRQPVKRYDSDIAQALVNRLAVLITKERK